MLTKHQSEKLAESLNILSTGNRLLISGSAGVGKTFLVNTLVKQFPNSTIVCSAPTNKAVAVLKNKVDKTNNISFITTHSALKLKRSIDFKTGAVSFKPSYDSKYPPLREVKFLIIDEASMLNTSLLKYAEESADKQNCKLIFLGDSKQLPPVGEEISPVFSKDFPEVELTEIIRQKGGSPIIELSRDLNLIKSKKPLQNENGGYIFTEDYDKIINTLAFVNGTDKLKFLAYTNRKVDLINQKVRQKIYGNPAKIEKGETLVFNAPYKDSYFTNEELLVKEVIIREKNFSFLVDIHNEKSDSVKIKYYSINPVKVEEPLFDSKDTWTSDKKVKTLLTDDIIVIHEDSEKDFEKICSFLKDKAKLAEVPWVEFYRFNEQFADIKYNHALTVHKSQGSTFEQVIMDVRDINFNQNKEEKEKMLYTAVTRASNLIILYNT